MCWRKAAALNGLCPPVPSSRHVVFPRGIGDQLAAVGFGRPRQAARDGALAAGRGHARGKGVVAATVEHNQPQGLRAARLGADAGSAMASSSTCSGFSSSASTGRR